MATEQYHEPANELSQDIRTFARMLQSLVEEAEAIGWYEQRMSLEKDKSAKANLPDKTSNQLLKLFERFAAFRHPDSYRY